MKQFLFFLLIGSNAMAQIKESPIAKPRWSIAFELDQISLPSFRKFKPEGRPFFKSFGVSVGRMLHYPSDQSGIFHNVFAGVFSNSLELFYRFEPMKVVSICQLVIRLFSLPDSCKRKYSINYYKLSKNEIH